MWGEWGMVWLGVVGWGLGVFLVGFPVDKDDLINYQLLIIYQLLIRTFTYQPTVDKTIVLSTIC